MIRVNVIVIYQLEFNLLGDGTVRRGESVRFTLACDKPIRSPQQSLDTHRHDENQAG